MSIPADEYVQLYRHESWSSEGTFGLKILTHGFDKSDEADRAARKAADDLLNALHLIRVKNDPERQKARIATIRDLLSCFSGPIWHQEVKNQYCSKLCCWHLPWLSVITTAGPVTIGWRKRVISISWDTATADEAEKLFPDEEVTKFDRTIHAWSLQKATEYLQKICPSTHCEL